MHEYRKDVDRDYSSEWMDILDPSLWDYSEGIHNKEQMMSMFGIYTMRMGNVQELDWSNGVDPVHDYSQNMYGYRDPEYTGPVDILTAGCSQTFGQGVHLQGRWSNLLSKKLGLTSATLAVPGWSTQSSISAVMHYIKRFGKPKIVTLLLPDAFRFDTMLNGNYCLPENYAYEPGEPVWVSHVTRSEPNINTPKYAKRPYPIDKIINAEAATFAAGQAIAHFAEYCKEANITFIWGTWDFRFDYLVRKIKSLVIEDKDRKYMSDLGRDEALFPHVQLDEYLDMEFFHHERGTVERFSAMDCHQDLRDLYGDCCFDRGTDKQDHMGVHLHAHVAEKFYDRLVELGY